MKLFIIHGWAYSTAKWQTALDLLAKSGVEPVMLNVPGLTSPSDQVWNIDSYVEWLNEQLKHTKNPVVLGHSNGGRIALNYCLKYPTKIKHLLLLDSAGIANTSKLVSFKLNILKTLAKLLKPTKFIPGFNKLIHRLIGASDYQQAPANMKQTLRNMIESDKNLELSKITTPVSLIWGHQDGQTPLNDAYKLSRLLPGAKSVEVIDDARHAPYDTHPQELVERLIKIIDTEKLR
ncbi:alpha/beta hydrolase [Candidatus Saccharibacteria bacterium]|nr:alpha/beta hydrolase [Candidatus Saccharibacteria bacterium]MCB9821710.1 alpha/beta hydrolase [Candidatus Nomurabacteria bacterium]